MTWNFHLNFSVISIIIISTFNLFISLFIFLRIPEKSTATRHLGLLFFASAMLALGFLPGYGFDNPMMAYHRYITVSAILLVQTELGQLFYHFPRTAWPRLAKTALIVQHTLTAGAVIWFIAITTARAKVFSFSGHFWDFDADNESLMIGALVLVYVVHAIFAGILNIIALKGSRTLILALMAPLLAAVFAPTITNILSREGAMTRDLHQTIMILCSITGYFAALMIYLNNTSEKTTFMVKIVGVSLVLFMVVIVFISYFSFQDKEDAYDLVHVEQTSRLAIEPKYSVKDLQHLRFYDLKKRSVDTEIKVAADWDEIDNFAIFEKINSLPSENFRQNLTAILETTPPHFALYRKLLQDLAATERSPENLLNAATRLQGRIRYRATKIQALPKADFRNSLDKYTAKMPALLSAFRTGIQDYARSQSAMEPEGLRKEILRMMKPFYGKNTREYRYVSATERYTAFLSYAPDKQQVSEALYSYENYLGIIHKVGFKLVLIFISVVIVILVGFRIFFLGVLIRPLDALLGGVDRVNNGDFEVELKQGIPDEIGFLTRSFNGMVASIRFARQKLKDHADQLEEKVEERTAELRTTLNEVQLLKQQQDGDYFLTSLLIKPLAQNRASNGRVRVDFLVEQKKKFTFRKWKDEIGGDFCNAGSLKLNDREYTLFINADAMGKSMQGAGGALVLGAVFESILDRTRLVPAFYNKSPERWLKNAFEELQAVFESFDGSMLVSIVLGLIDDQTGLLYYINAEHPWTVLYRGGAAEFIDREFEFRKLGVSGLKGQLHIKTLQLQPQDVLILGSDGRDDLRLNSDEAAGLINEDENLFLRNVEAGRGELPQIYKQLTQVGEFTDDLSMIRVSYLEEGQTEENAPVVQKPVPELQEAKKLITENDAAKAKDILEEILAENPRHLPAMKMLVRLLVHAKAYDRAYEVAEDYVILKPADTNMLFLISSICKRLGKNNEAIEYGERVRLRSPGFVINLVHLATVYAAMSNNRRAKKLLQEALKVDAGNERAHTLLAQM